MDHLKQILDFYTQFEIFPLLFFEALCSSLFTVKFLSCLEFWSKLVSEFVLLTFVLYQLNALLLRKWFN